MLVQKLIQLLAPPACVGCQTEGQWLCGDCWPTDLPDPLCFSCERPSPLGITCADCARRQQLRRLTVGALHQDSVASLIRQLKFQRARSAAQPAATLILAAMDRRLTYDVVTAIPVAPSRHRERGYNQAELIGRIVARELGIPYRTLMRRHDTVHQIGLGRTERQAAIRGSFMPTMTLNGQRLLVIDDVVTTGATLSEAARTLMAAGAGSVEGGAVTRKLNFQSSR